MWNKKINLKFTSTSTQYLKIEQNNLYEKNDCVSLTNTNYSFFPIPSHSLFFFFVLVGSQLKRKNTSTEYLPNELLIYEGFVIGKTLPTVQLSSSTTSTFLSRYSTLKSSIRGCLSTICLDGITGRNAEEEEGAGAGAG